MGKEKFYGDGHILSESKRNELKYSRKIIVMFLLIIAKW